MKTASLGGKTFRSLTCLNLKFTYSIRAPTFRFHHLSDRTLPYFVMEGGPTLLPPGRLCWIGVYEPFRLYLAPDLMKYSWYHNDLFFRPSFANTMIQLELLRPTCLPFR